MDKFVIDATELGEVERQMLLDTFHRLRLGKINYGVWDVNSKPEWVTDGIEEHLDSNLYVLAQLYRLRKMLTEQPEGAC